MPKMRCSSLTAVALSVSLLTASLNAAGMPMEPVDAEGGDTSAQNGMAYENTYSHYLLENGELLRFSDKVQADMDTAEPAGNAELGEFDGRTDVAFLVEPGSGVILDLQIPRGGYYCLFMDYAGNVASDKEIELSVRIDGKLPFFEADELELSRCYVNDTDVFEEDSRGNQLRPGQQQIVYWQETPLYQKENGSCSPYYFYFSEGVHTVEVTAANGGMYLAGMRAQQDAELISYADYQEQYAEKAIGGPDRVIQGEEAVRKSSMTLYPITDRTSCLTQPFAEGRTLLNTIGGANWSKPGQWIEWEFEVKTEGLYQLALRVRQNQNSGMKCYRTISINGEVPFKELEAYGFRYDRSWYIETLSDPVTGEPFSFYLTPGKYTLRMEATTGEMNEPLEAVNNLLEETNALYRSIIMITGTTPDAFRDYNLEQAIPGLVDTLNDLARRFDEQMENIKTITGGSGVQAASLTTLSTQMRGLAERPKTISDRVNNFYANISAVSAWAQSAGNQPVEIDYIRVGTQNSPALKANAGFFQSLISACKSFVYSFLVDYDTIGSTSENGRSIEVWMTVGRDQAEALKQLIDRDFSTQYHIGVSLKLVQGGLVEANVAGTGPDIALNIAMNQPVDFASRGILAELEDMPGFNELVDERFYPSALIPYRYKGHTYALPETQEFDMMFYREDILTELQLSPPETWDQLTSMMNVLARNNMQVGVLTLTTTTAGVINTSFPKTVLTMLMQNDVDLYAEDARSTNLATPEAVAVFESLTDLYNKYGLPVYFDYAIRN